MLERAVASVLPASLASYPLFPGCSFNVVRGAGTASQDGGPQTHERTDTCEAAVVDPPLGSSYIQPRVHEFAQLPRLRNRGSSSQQARPGRADEVYNWRCGM